MQFPFPESYWPQIKRVVLPALLLLGISLDEYQYILNLGNEAPTTVNTKHRWEFLRKRQYDRYVGRKCDKQCKWGKIIRGVITRENLLGSGYNLKLLSGAQGEGRKTMLLHWQIEDNSFKKSSWGWNQIISSGQFKVRVLSRPAICDTTCFVYIISTRCQKALYYYD